MDCQATLSISVTQCDPTSATTPLHWPAPATVHVSCPAKQLAAQQRRDLAIQVLAGTETVSELAREHEVSRKFLYQQVHTAQQGARQCLRPCSAIRGGPLLPAGYQVLAAATGPGLGVHRV